MTTEGIEVRSVGNTLTLHETALIEAFNLKAAIEYQLKNCMYLCCTGLSIILILTQGNTVRTVEQVENARKLLWVYMATCGSSL